MASFLCDLVKKYVEKLIDGAISEARHVFCFTCIVKEFEDERTKLEPERKTIEQRVKVAKEKDNDIQANVVSWVEEIDKLNQVDTKTKQTCFLGFCPDCMWRYKKGKELANNLEDIKRLLEKGPTFVNIELPRPLPDVERYSTKDYISFKSREAKQKELLDALKDDNNYIIGLQGMGGTGKTTMAKEVGKELKQSDQFAYVVDTTVSFTPDIKKIQDEIAGSLGLKLDEFNEADRPKKLWSRLTNGDKILVILDDVWDRGPPLDFDAIGIPKRDKHKGCRVLVTSRDKQTFNKMDCDKRIELGLLSEEDAWLMFQMYAGIGDSFPKKLIDKAHEIAIECKQLPVAISVIASSLKGQQDQEVELDVTLNSLKQPVVSMHGVDDDMAEIYKCLKFSYDNLKDEKAKGLFLLCSVFREDEEYSVEVLTRLCIGVGLFGDDDDRYNDARKKVVVAKKKLVDSCLLLEDDEKCLKMHDLVREAAQWIAKEEIQCVKLFDKKQMSLVEKQTNIKYLLCEGKCMDLFSFNFDGSKLETLIVKVDRDYDCKYIEVPNSFFRNIIKLRVLYFSGNYTQHLSLPSSIQLLKNIRSMLVDNVDLGDISILGNLQSLETLDLVQCKIKEFPDQITKLSKFKLLKLEYCEIRMSNPFEVIKRCSSLEELYFKDSFNDFCHEITFLELQRYQINKGGWERYEFSKYVVFRGDQECQFSEKTLKYCMQTAEVLCLEGIKGEWRNLMPEIVELGMNDLVELYLGDMPQLQCLIDTIGYPLLLESLNNLEKLSIVNCEHLRSLFKGKLNLCKLKTITLKRCFMLLSLFEVSTSRSLVLLETLEIADCVGLKTIIADDSGNNKSHGSVFSKLKVIDIERCHRLESVLPFLSAQDLPSLETIKIRYCDGLKYVFGQSQHVELVSLSQLELCELPKFIGIFEECYDPMSSCVKGSSSTSKPQIQLDPIKCNILSCCQTRIPLVDDVDGDQPHDYSVASESNSYNIWEHLRIQSKILCNIKEIVLSHFPKMKSVFILSIAPIMQLETLNINNCDELKHIIIDIGDHNTSGNNWVNVFPKLKELYVEDCEQLEYIFGHGTSIDHQNYMEIQLHFPELRQLKLAGLPSLIAMCPKQYRITFPSLKNLELGKCSHDNTIIKELIGNVDHFLTLEILELCNFNVQNIFSLNEIDGQQLDLGLQYIRLSGLPMMTCLFVGPKNSFALKNLTSIDIVRCDKLKFVFSTSILRFLPQLCVLSIEECNELEHIIEDDLENKDNSNSTCFPKLELLDVRKCNKLKFVFSTSMLRFLPQLCYLRIEDCNELEHIIEDDDDDGLENKQNSNSFSSGTCFPKLEELVVINCNKLKLVFSTSILRFLPQLLYLRIEECKELEHIIEDDDDDDDLENIKKSNSLSSTTCFPKLKALVVIKCNKLKFVFPLSVCKELPNLKALLIREANELEEIFKSEDDDHKVDIPNLNIVALDMLPSLCCAQGNQFQAVKNRFVRNCQKLTLTSASTTNTFEDINDLYSTGDELRDLFKQLPSEETAEDFELPSVENVPGLTILPTNSELEGSTSEKTAVATVSSISGTKNEPPKQKGIVTEGTSKTNNDPKVSLNDDAFMKVNSTVEEEFPKDDEMIVSKSKPSPSIKIPTASQFPSVPSKGNPSQKVEDLSFSLLVKRELEQLVSKNHLDYENLSLLTDFLVKNPSIHLKDTSLPNRYKGCAYNLLAELLKFLETHSLLEVSGSCHSEFVELLQDARYFGFDKEWLDGVERRALFPEIQSRCIGQIIGFQETGYQGC